jgi:cytochrome b involved in lipid metabolism
VAVKSGFTAAEVAAHNSPTDCYYIYSNKVVDITQYIANDLHPGGQQHYLPCHGGRPCTAWVCRRAAAVACWPCTLSGRIPTALPTSPLLLPTFCPTAGNSIMYPCCGRDCTSDFDSAHRGQRALREQEQYYIGDFIAS